MGVGRIAKSAMTTTRILKSVVAITVRFVQHAAYRAFVFKAEAKVNLLGHTSGVYQC